MVHYIGDLSFFSSFFKNPVMSDFFIFIKNINELRIRLNNEIFKNITIFYVGDIADVEKVHFHSGFQGKIDYLFVNFFREEKRKEILKMLSPETDYYKRHLYLSSLYKEIMDVNNDFFVYSPAEIIFNNTENVILKDLSFFALFNRKNVLMDEDALLEKIKVQVKDPSKFFIADNKDNFIVSSL
jgi:hypothetical protein